MGGLGVIFFGYIYTIKFCQDIVMNRELGLSFKEKKKKTERQILNLEKYSRPG